MKSNFTPKFILLAIASATLYSCSVNDDDQLVNQKDIEPQIELHAKNEDSAFVQPGEPMIPKPPKD